MNLTQLATKHRSDKGNVKQAHMYTLAYELLFYPYKNRPVSLMEMGLQIGGPENGFDASRETNKVPSVSMWLEYFDDVHVTGVDISDFSWVDDPNFEYIHCDMDKRQNLKKLAESVTREYDFIIDDASHASHHQQYGFLELWKTLKPGGLYIIEDLHWQPKAYEKPDFTKTGELFRAFTETGKFSHSDTDLERDFTAIAPEISLAYVFPHRYIRRKANKFLVVHKQPDHLAQVIGFA